MGFFFRIQKGQQIKNDVSFDVLLVLCFLLGLYDADLRSADSISQQHKHELGCLIKKNVTFCWIRTIFNVVRCGFDSAFCLSSVVTVIYSVPLLIVVCTTVWWTDSPLMIRKSNTAKQQQHLPITHSIPRNQT